MRNDFNEHHMTQVPTTENQLEEIQMMEEISDHMGMNYPEIHDSRFVAQPVDDFLSPWEEAGSAEFSITKVEDEVFSETMTPPVLQPPVQHCATMLLKRTLRTLLQLLS